MELLDSTNRKILNILQREGRITNADLAERLGVAPATTLDRVKKLERQGYIRDYVALLNPAKVNCGATVFAFVSLTQHTVEAINGFKDAISQLPEVMEVHHLAGEYDFLLKLFMRDVAHYEDFAVHRLTTIPHIGRIQTSFALRVVKNQTMIPLDEI